MPGMFIAIEGGDRTGKSTVAGALTERWEAAGLSVLRTREPGGTKPGRKLRRLVKNPRYEFNDWAELFTFLADRSLHVEQMIRPALESHDVVLCDRYADSTLAYQGHGRGLDLDILRRLNERATGGLYPDATIVLHLTAGIRVGAEGHVPGDRIEQADLSFHQRVADGFLEIAREGGDSYAVIDASMPKEDVLAATIAELEPRLRAFGLTA